jgi:hypothetical protein
MGTLRDVRIVSEKRIREFIEREPGSAEAIVAFGLMPSMPRLGEIRAI